MYQLIDTGKFQKLEQIGPWRVIRPAMQAVWKPHLPEREWSSADAIFTRFSGGDGRWEIRNRKLPAHWSIPVPAVGSMQIELTDFGHLGIFPEQHTNWARLGSLIEPFTQAGRAIQVLNLFAYTGGSTLACARAGAHVVHLDASKTSVAWGRTNAEASGLQDKPIRWIVDDVQKFIAREARRGSQYHGIILDPPSFGRGPKGETWKIEEMLPPLLEDLAKLLADDYLFFLLSSHSAGYTPLALSNLVSEICSPSSGNLVAEEMIVREQSTGRPLPSGASCMYIRHT